MKQEHQPEDKVTFSRIDGEPPKDQPRDRSKDNEIKTMMAKDMFCSMIETAATDIGKDALNNNIEVCIQATEVIFNRFNK